MIDVKMFLIVFFLSSFLTVLGLCCFVPAFSSYSEWELLFVVVHRLLVWWLLL